MYEPQETIQIQTKPILLPAIEIKPAVVDIKRYGHNDFLEKIGHFESGNNYNKVNRYGYMGRYQFGMKTLKAIDIKTTRTEFLNNPNLQEEAMDRLLKANQKTLNRYIKKYEGKKVNGILITESGVLAAAHLGGAGNVRKWFRSGQDFKDANGTPITKYMRVFSGYSLSID